MIHLLLAAALASEDPEIEVHLLDVARTLRAETPPDLPDEVRARRLDLLDALEQYALAGDYPDHRGVVPLPGRSIAPPRAFASADPAPRRPRFVDDEGTHCAVGYLLTLSDPALARRIDRLDPYGYLPELDVPGVDTWAAWAGFTRDELAWIQPSYRIPLPSCDDPDVLAVELPADPSCSGFDLTFVSPDWRDGCVEGCWDARPVVWVANTGDVASPAATLSTADETASWPVPALQPGTYSTIVLPAQASVWAGVAVHAEGDCDPGDDTTTPGAYLDSGRAVRDGDGDGYADVTCGGTDCDDAVARVSDVPDCGRPDGGLAPDTCDASCATYACVRRLTGEQMVAPDPDELAACLALEAHDTGLDTDTGIDGDPGPDGDAACGGCDTPGPARAPLLLPLLAWAARRRPR